MPKVSCLHLQEAMLLCQRKVNIYLSSNKFGDVSSYRTVCREFITLAFFIFSYSVAIENWVESSR